MILKYKKFPSKYELYYIKWNGINFDKDKLVQFIKRINFLKITSFFYKPHKEELIILKEIYHSYNQKTLEGLLNNDETISRNGLIEKWSRIAAIDILLTSTYSRATYTVISNLPIQDYQLVLKRIEELVKIGQNIRHQSDNISKDIPGYE